MTFKNISLVTLAVLGTVSLSAAELRDRSNVDALRRAQDRVARSANQTKGGAQARLLLESQRLQQLIDDLDAGKPVDPSEIDRTLQRSANPGF